MHCCFEAVAQGAMLLVFNINNRKNERTSQEFPFGANGHEENSNILSLSTFKEFQESFSELWHPDCVNNGINKRVCVA